jgi:hypothetical protein
MKIGDLVRYRKIIDHRSEEMTEWRLGVLVEKRHNICDILSRNGVLVTVWASLVQKAGKKDAKR